MTRKDYIAIAGALKIVYQRAQLSIVADGDHIELDAPPMLYQGRLDGVDFAAQEIATALEHDNSCFDRDHFLAVVRGQRELNSHPRSRVNAQARSQVRAGGTP